MMVVPMTAKPPDLDFVSCLSVVAAESLDVGTLADPRPPPIRTLASSKDTIRGSTSMLNFLDKSQQS